MRILGIAALVWALAAVPSPGAEDPRRRPATTWDVALAPPDEPGERFELRGVVRNGGGDEARGTKVFVYHADARGEYARADGVMRLAATLRTDKDGRYRLRTVFPGSYGGYAAHVHFEILEPGHAAGFVNVRPEGRAAPTPERSFMARRGKDGVWRLSVDLRPGASTPRVISLGSWGRPRPARDADAWAPPRRDTTADRRPR